MQKKPKGKVRVIAGQWRGRLLTVPPVAAIRPTPDRVRETVFNWLQPFIAGARVLDLYAGTGVLGIEALSRGARHATFIEQNSLATRALNQQLVIFEAQSRACVHTASVLQAGSLLEGHPYDVVFIDPPYDARLLTATLSMLEATGSVHSRTLLYVEQRRKDPEEVPAGFGVYKHQAYGAVDYSLLQQVG